MGSSGGSTPNTLSIVGVVFFAVVIGIFASYFLYSMGTYVSSVSVLFTNITNTFPYATNGPIPVAPTVNAASYLFKILSNPMSIAALIFFGFLMYALSIRLRQRQ